MTWLASAASTGRAASDEGCIATGHHHQRTGFCAGSATGHRRVDPAGVQTCASRAAMSQVACGAILEKSTRQAPAPMPAATPSGPEYRPPRPRYRQGTAAPSALRGQRLPAWPPPARRAPPAGRTWLRHGSRLSAASLRRAGGPPSCGPSGPCRMQSYPWRHCAVPPRFMSLVWQVRSEQLPVAQQVPVALAAQEAAASKNSRIWIASLRPTPMASRKRAASTSPLSLASSRAMRASPASVACGY